MAWRWIGDKPLSEPMLTRFSDAYMIGREYRNIFAFHITSWHLDGTCNLNTYPWNPMTCIAHNKYHGCWCLGDVRSWRISSHNFDLVLPEYSTFIIRWIYTLRPRQEIRHFADDIFTCIFFNENCSILIKISLKYVRKGPIDNNRALVQIMALRRSGDKPLSEPMMVSLPTHICVTELMSRVNLVRIIRSHAVCSMKLTRADTICYFSTFINTKWS